MSAARKPKALTPITEYEEQELSLKAIEVLPEQLQVRATLDKGWSKRYANDYIKGDTFPPVLVYWIRETLPDGRALERLILVDGFHRFDACLAIGKKTIRAQIREGTIEDAVLAAIEANTADYHRGRPFKEEDRFHALDLLFGQEKFWGYSDNWLGSITGVSCSHVGKARLAYHIEHGVAIPDRVMRRDGTSRRYRGAHRGKQAQSIKCNNGSYYIIDIGDGNRTYLGGDKTEAQRKADELFNIKIDQRESLSVGAMVISLTSRGIHTKAANSGRVNNIRGFLVRGAVVTVARFDQDDTAPWVAGCLMMLRVLSGDPSLRMVCVCLTGDGDRRSIDLARILGIEFLSPDEFVASLQADEQPPTYEPEAEAIQ